MSLPLFPTTPDIVDNALLIASLRNIATPHFLAPAITAATLHTRRRLIIVLFSRLFNANSPPPYVPNIQAVSHTQHWEDVQRLLTFVYVHATKTAQDAGKMLLQVDVLLKGLNEDLDTQLGTGMEIVFRISGDACPVPLPESISLLRHCYLTVDNRCPEATEINCESDTHVPLRPKAYPVVALGGTFDHLHAGHKILLTIGAWIATTKLIVGVTDDSLLVRKAYQEVLEPQSVRTSRVRDFLTLLKPDLVYDVVLINDIYGPTGWDPNIQALVVSKETKSGGDAVVSHRAKQGLPALDVYTIDVISSSSASLDHEDMAWLKQSKLSSTSIREWIVNRNRQETDGRRAYMAAN